MAAILDFANMAAPIKNPNSLTQGTSRPNSVLLEESDKKIPITQTIIGVYLYLGKCSYIVICLHFFVISTFEREYEGML